MTALTSRTDRCGDDVLLRRARAEDVPAIVELVESAYRGEGGWTTEAHLVDGARTDADEVAALLADDAVTLLLAEAGGVVLGSCCSHREDARAVGPHRAELGLFAVHPSAQSRGLGSRLLEAQASHLPSAGVGVLMIRVLQSRPELHAWYERHGFLRTGETVPFAGDVDQLKVAGLGMDVMERQLDPAP